MHPNRIKVFCVSYDTSGLAAGGANLYTVEENRPFVEDAEINQLVISLSTIGGLPDATPEIQLIISKNPIDIEQWTSQTDSDLPQVLYHNWFYELPYNEVIAFEQPIGLEFFENLYLNMYLKNNDVAAFGRVVKAHYSFHYEQKGKFGRIR